MSAQIAALPAEALASYAEVVGVLQLVPWQGKPYLILEDQLRVGILKVIWTD
ncbi:MAG TPA: hypothetical protein VGJ45_40900 [Pseudonocardiaceae bacterium]